MSTRKEYPSARRCVWNLILSEPEAWITRRLAELSTRRRIKSLIPTAEFDAGSVTVTTPRDASIRNIPSADGERLTLEFIGLIVLGENEFSHHLPSPSLTTLTSPPFSPIATDVFE